MVDVGPFRDSDVDPSLWATAHLPTIFEKLDVNDGLLDDAVGDWRMEYDTDAGKPTDTPITDFSEEIKDLFELRTNELFDDYLPEIGDQAGSFSHYFYHILNINPRSQPNCARLIALCMQLAGTVGLRYKLLYMRPRPSQICPALVPIIPVPAHPAYPSNHATQSALTTEMLKAVLRHDQNSGLCLTLETLGDRIAENRERAGLHYKSDSDAGKRLGRALAKKLEAALCDRDSVLNKAREELAHYKNGDGQIDFSTEAP